MQEQADVVETDEKEARRLKGEVEKMVVRRNTAKYINSVYQKSLRELTKTRPNVEHELDQYEKELNKKTDECDELREISDKILFDRDQVLNGTKQQLFLLFRHAPPQLPKPPV